jgi:hypothetical protein
MRKSTSIAAAARVVPEWVTTEVSARCTEALQRRADRAKKVRDHVVAAAGALAAIAAEVALLIKMFNCEGYSEPFLPPISRACRTWIALACCPPWAAAGQQRSLRKMRHDLSWV